MSTSAPVGPAGLSFPLDLPDAYGSDAVLSIDASGSDAVTLFFDLDGAVSSFMFRLLGDGHLFTRLESGNTVAEEVTHDPALSSKFAVRVLTKGVSSIEVQMKASAAVAGGLVLAKVSFEGTDNNTRVVA